MNSVQFNPSVASSSFTPNLEGGTGHLEALALRHLASSSAAWRQPEPKALVQSQTGDAVVAPERALPASVSEYGATPKPVELLVMDSFTLSPEEVAAGKTRSHGEETSYVAAHSTQSGNVQVFTTQAQELHKFTDQLNVIADSDSPPKVINISLGLDPASVFLADFKYFNNIFELRHGADRGNWSEETWASYKQDVGIVAEGSVLTFQRLVGVFPQDLHRVLKKLVDAGVTVTIAAGNQGEILPLFSDLGLTPPEGFFDGVYLPDMPEGVIFVGASEDSASPTSTALFASPNRQMDVVADGTDIKVTDLGTLSSGSSLAAPQIAALVADMLVANPELKPGEIEAILKDSATEASGGPDRVGRGLVDRERALAIARGELSQAPLVDQVTGYFDGWDGGVNGSVKDGLISMSDLQAVAKNTSLTLAERAAAQQLLDQPDLFNSWERSLNGEWDELLSVSDMILWNARQNTVNDPAFSAADVAQINFYQFDTTATPTPDGLFNRDDLSRIMTDGVSTGSMKSAAQYLFDHSDLFDQLDSAQDGKLDGNVSFRDIGYWQLAHSAEA